MRDAPAGAPAPPSGGPLPPAQRTLTEGERRQLTAEIRLAFHYQRTLWEVIRDGVALGAEEVQDQRLLAAETPPEANPALDAFIFFLMWAVEGPLASTLIEGVQRMVVNGLKRQMRLQARAYRRLIEMEASARPAIDEARRIAAARAQRAARRVEAAGAGGFGREQRARIAVERAEAAQRELARLESLARRESRQFPSVNAMNARSDLRQTALALRGIRRADLPDYIAAVPNIALQQSIRFPQPGRDPGISPGVTLRAQVDRQALELIQESYLQQECYELLAQDEHVTAAQASVVFEDIGAQTPVNIGGVLDHYRLIAAALIWAQLFDTAGLRIRRAAEQDAARRTQQRFAGDPRPPFGRPFTAPEQHQKYLVARFGPAAESWARDRPQDVLLPGPYPLPFGPPTPQEVEGYLSAGQGTAPLPVLQRFSEFLGSPAAGPGVLRLDLVLQWFSALAEQAPDSVIRLR
jgi:hypothetical protein